MDESLSYDEFDKKYPCPDRVGIGYSGCRCNNTSRENPQLVNCRAYASHNYPRLNCLQCPYRMQYIERLKQQNI
jgi:hypothetical protein